MEKTNHTGLHRRAHHSQSLAADANAPVASGTASLDDAGEGLRIQKRPRRTHARRSCQMCQQRKARCELPDLEVPSGPLPLPDHQACHRCRTLQISCIVDDANKKKAKKPIAETNTTRPLPSRMRSSNNSLSGMQTSSNNASLSSTFGDRMSISSTGSTSAGLMPSGVAYTEVESLKFAGGRELGNHIVYPAEPCLAPRTPDSSADEESASASAVSPGRVTSSSAAGTSETYIKTQDRNPKDAANIDTWERYSTRSRPLTLLTELVPRQNGFASKVFRLVSARATIETDITEIISNEKSKMLSDWCEDNLTLWLPHVSNAYQIRQEALQGKQTLSTQLLEQVLYLIAMQHIRDPEDDVLRFSVARFIIRDTARLMMTSPRSSKAVEALELLALFPVDVSVIPGPSRNRVRTDALIGSAERFARSVRLDRVALTAAAPYSFIASNNQLDDFETKRTAMVWASVKTWNTSFTIGDDELYESVDERFFSDDWSRSLMLPLHPDAIAADTSAYQSTAEPDPWQIQRFAEKRWSRKRRFGSIGLAMRCLAMRQLLLAFHAIRTTPIDLPESERVAKVSAIVDNYEGHIASIDEEFRQRLASNAASCHLLRTWLTTETTGGQLLVLGAGILRGLGIDKKENLPCHELVPLIRGENASPEMRAFLTRYGESRVLAAERLLVNISSLCYEARAGKLLMPEDPRMRTSHPDFLHPHVKRRWMIEGRSRTVLPTMNVCGYALEAAFNAMEMHATMFKLWKTPPKRSESWQLVFSDVVAAISSLDPTGSIRNGSIPATCGYILQGMLKVIVAWTDCSRQKESQRSATTLAATGHRDDPNSAWQNGKTQSQAPEGSAASSKPDVDRYSELLQDDLTSCKSGFDALQSFGWDQAAGSSTSATRPTPEESSLSMPAPLFESGDMPSSSQYSEVSTDYPVAQTLEAALSHNGNLTAAPAAPVPSHYFGPYRAAPSTNASLGASDSSNSSSHAQTPPYYEPVAPTPRSAGGLGMMTTNSNGSSTLSLIDAAHHAQYGHGDTHTHTHTHTHGNGHRDNEPTVALDTLEFILHDVLGSSEWSGIIQDIWRTDL